MTTASAGHRLGLLGRKVGMMRVFTDDGDAIPVTVLDVSNNRVAQVKTEQTDGYNAIQVAFGSRKASRVSKPEAGHLAKAGVEAGEILKEFRVAADVAAEYKSGARSWCAKCIRTRRVFASACWWSNAPRRWCSRTRGIGGPTCTSAWRCPARRW